MKIKYRKTSTKIRLKISLSNLDKFKIKFLEIREEVRDLLPNNEGVFDAVIAPVFFVVLANFVDLNTAIFSTGGLLVIFLIYRKIRKQDLKFVFYGFIGSAIALLLARLQGSASGFFIPGIVRDATISIFGLISILIRKPFTIYSSKAFRNWLLKSFSFTATLTILGLSISILELKSLARVPISHLFLFI